MPQLNAKTKKLIFYAIMAGIFAYLAFIMISFYSSDRVGMVKLSFSVNEENIVTSAYATYKMKPGEGRLTLSQDNDLKLPEPENAVSHAIILSTQGNPVTEVELELEPITEDALLKLAGTNDWNVGQIDEVSELVCK